MRDGNGCSRKCRTLARQTVFCRDGWEFGTLRVEDDVVYRLKEEGRLCILIGSMDCKDVGWWKVDIVCRNAALEGIVKEVARSVKALKQPRTKLVKSVEDVV